jgi:hypothetical protein
MLLTLSMIKLSLLAVVLGLGYGIPQIYGIAKPAAYAGALRKFPRSLAWGIVLTLAATAWFLWNVSQESIADLASYKTYLMLVFAGIGIGTCIFVHDFLAVRGLAVVLLLLAKLMVDSGRPLLPETSSVLVIQIWAYVLVIVGMWLTVSPWRLRDWIAWATATEARTKLVAASSAALGLIVAALGFAKY